MKKQPSYLQGLQEILLANMTATKPPIEPGNAVSLEAKDEPGDALSHGAKLAQGHALSLGAKLAPGHELSHEAKLEPEQDTSQNKKQSKPYARLDAASLNKKAQKENDKATLAVLVGHCLFYLTAAAVFNICIKADPSPGV